MTFCSEKPSLSGIVSDGDCVVPDELAAVAVAPWSERWGFWVWCEPLPGVGAVSVLPNDASGKPCFSLVDVEVTLPSRSVSVTPLLVSELWSIVDDGSILLDLEVSRRSGLSRASEEQHSDPLDSPFEVADSVECVFRDVEAVDDDPSASVLNISSS